MKNDGKINLNKRVIKLPRIITWVVQTTRLGLIGPPSNITAANILNIET